jgi:hypothetical protein
VVIGIQVFQHGDRAAAHEHLRAAQRRVTPGGLFCLRVNATATDIWPAHEVTAHDPASGRCRTTPDSQVAQSTAWRRRRQVDPAASAATPASGRYHSHEAPGPAPYPT